jgi:MSHA biogenesis protein MshJ
MIAQYWQQVADKLNKLSLRERIFVFAAVAFVLFFVVNTFLLTPLAVQQKAVQSQLLQQQQQLRDVQSQIVLLQQQNSPTAHSPQRLQINQLKQEIAEGDIFLNSRRERLVQPEKMAAHLRQLLGSNSRLQLVSLKTLAVTPLLELSNKKDSPSAGKTSLTEQENQVFAHGVELTLRGNYLDLFVYLKAIEKLPQQMYWSRANMQVVHYPNAELTLVLYTLSLDKTWLKI